MILDYTNHYSLRFWWSLTVKLLFKTEWTILSRQSLLAQNLQNKNLCEIDYRLILKQFKLNIIKINNKYILSYHQQVLKILEENCLFLKPSKCEFEKTMVEYLGVIISHNSVEMDSVKVARVVEWPTPSNKKEVQSFLRFVNLYCRFIQDFSHHARPLFNLTKNVVKWHWGTKEQLAFDMLKNYIISAPILTSPDNSIKANSSDFATGAVLSQQSPEDGK